jgi:hypothetical protein
VHPEAGGGSGIFVVIPNLHAEYVCAWIIAGKLEVVVPRRIKRVVADGRFHAQLRCTLEIKNNISIARVRIEWDKTFRPHRTHVDFVRRRGKRVLRHGFL